MMFSSSARWQQVLFWGVALGSAASVALAALPVVTRISQQDRIWQAASERVRSVVPEAEVVSLQPVLDLAPFGRAAMPADSSADDADSAKAPAETADLVLLGVVVGSEPAASMAMISVAGAAPANFRVGDALGDGLVLQEIRPEQVALSQAGQSLVLRFPDAWPEGGEPAAETASGDGFLRNLIPTAAAPASGQSAEPASAASVLAELQRNPAAVLQQHGLVGQAGGYAVTGSASVQVMAAGLRPGDMVVALNGEALAGSADDWPLFDRVAVSGTARITIERGGATQELTVDLP